MGSKGQNHALARGPPESAEGRSSDEDEGECFAPLIFCLKFIDFCVKMLFFWSRNGSRLIWDHPQKNIKFSKIIKILTFFVTHFLTVPGLPVVRLSSY